MQGNCTKPRAWEMAGRTSKEQLVAAIDTWAAEESKKFRRDNDFDVVSDSWGCLGERSTISWRYSWFSQSHSSLSFFAARQRLRLSRRFACCKDPRSCRSFHWFLLLEYWNVHPNAVSPWYHIKHNNPSKVRRHHHAGPHIIILRSIDDRLFRLLLEPTDNRNNLSLSLAFPDLLPCLSRSSCRSDDSILAVVVNFDGSIGGNRYSMVGLQSADHWSTTSKEAENKIRSDNFSASRKDFWFHISILSGPVVRDPLRIFVLLC